MTETQFTLMDVFSGIGGFSLAGRNVGFKTLNFVEIDPFCRAVLAKNFPGVPIENDIRTFDGRPFRGRVNVLCGGFPCQDISVAGKQAGIENGARSGLWSEMYRIICECQPTFCLIENVSNLRNNGADRVLGDLETAGYTCGAFVVGADDIGASHRRKRVWIVGQLMENAGYGTGGSSRAVEEGVDTSFIGASDNDSVARPDSTLADPASARADGYPQRAGTEYALSGNRDCSLADTDGSGREELAGEESGRTEFPASEQFGALVACRFCGYGFDQDALGKYGCPNCKGEGLEDERDTLADTASDNRRLLLQSRQSREENFNTTGTLRSLPRFPPARNDYDGWAAVASMDAAKMPCVESEVCRLADEFSRDVVRRRRRTRNATLKALGNSIVPAVAELFLKWIYTQLTEKEIPI